MTDTIYFPVCQIILSRPNITFSATCKELKKGLLPISWDKGLFHFVCGANEVGEELKIFKEKVKISSFTSTQ